MAIFPSCESSPDRGQSRKIRFSKFPGVRTDSGFYNFSWEKSTKDSQNPGLVNRFSATPGGGGQLNWTGPIAKSSQRGGGKNGGQRNTSQSHKSYSEPECVLNASVSGFTCRPLQSVWSKRCFGRGMRRQFNEWGFGKDFYRKGNSVKRFGPFTELPDSENWKVAVLILVNCHPPPLPDPPKPPSRSLKVLPFLFWQVWGAGWGICVGGGGVRVAIYENLGFPNPGFRNLWEETGGGGGEMEGRGTPHKVTSYMGFRRCPSTVSCTVPSGESPNFRWIPSWEPN